MKKKYKPTRHTRWEMSAHHPTEDERFRKRLKRYDDPWYGRSWEREFKDEMFKIFWISVTVFIVSLIVLLVPHEFHFFRVLALYSTLGGLVACAGALYQIGQVKK